jgi:predicted nucleotidyltransferase
MLQELFSTNERVKILNVVLFEQGLNNASITRKADVNKGLVSIFTRSLIDKGIVEKRDRRYYFRSTPFVKQLKVLLNLSKMQDIEELIPGSIIGMGLFGSWADGSNDTDSDLDLWMMMDEIDHEEVGEVIQIIRERISSEPNILLLTPKKWKRMKKEDFPFTSSLLRNTITLAGMKIG